MREKEEKKLKKEGEKKRKKEKEKKKEMREKENEDDDHDTWFCSLGSMNFLPSFLSILSFPSLYFSLFLYLPISPFLLSFLSSLPVCSRFLSPSFIFPSFSSMRRRGKKGESNFCLSCHFYSRQKKRENWRKGLSFFFFWRKNRSMEERGKR